MDPLDAPAPQLDDSPAVTSRCGTLLATSLLPEEAHALLSLLGRPVDDREPDAIAELTVVDRIVEALERAPLLGGDPAATIGDLDALCLPSRGVTVYGAGSAAARMVLGETRQRGGTEPTAWALATGYVAGILARVVLHGGGGTEYAAGLARMITLCQAEHDRAR